MQVGTTKCAIPRRYPELDSPSALYVFATVVLHFLAQKVQGVISLHMRQRLSACATNAYEYTHWLTLMRVVTYVIVRLYHCDQNIYIYIIFYVICYTIYYDNIYMYTEGTIIL